jgi:arylsulfatase A-like enzyme
VTGHEGARRRGIGRCLLTALAAASLISGLDALLALRGGIPLSPTVLGWLALTIAVPQVLAALLLGRLIEDRAWTAAVLLFPIAFAARLSGGGFAIATVALCLLMAIGAALRWVWARRGSPAPLVGALAGDAAATGLLLFQDHARGNHGAEALPAALLVAGFAAGIWLVERAGRSRPFATLAPGFTAALLFSGVGLTGLAAILNPRAPLESAAAPSRPCVSGRAPIVLIVLDTVRADQLELYGHAGVTMPRLTRFARRYGITVERATSHSASSLPAHASLFTGLYPPHHGAHKPHLGDPDPPAYAYPLRDGIPTLAGQLSAAGYWSVGISANFGALGKEYGVGRGFDRYDPAPATLLTLSRVHPWVRALRDDLAFPMRALLESLPAGGLFDPVPVPYRRAAVVTNEAIATLNAAGHCNLFLFLNYFDAHEPYSPPGAVRHAFGIPEVDFDLWNEDVRNAILSGEREAGPDLSSYLQRRYEGELMYLDAELGRLLDHLENHERFEDTLVVITSDHGDSHGEHQTVGHSVSLYDELVHVPLVIKPGRETLRLPSPPATLPGPVQLVDLFAGIFEHAGLDLPEDIDGTPWGAGRSTAFGWLYPHPGLAEYVPERFDVELSFAETMPWKLIRTSRGEEALFDLVNDPHEREPREEDRPRRRLLEALDALPPAVDRSGSSDAASAELLENLRALGYIKSDGGP